MVEYCLKRYITIFNRALFSRTVNVFLWYLFYNLSRATKLLKTIKINKIVRTYFNLSNIHYTHTEKR